MAGFEKLTAVAIPILANNVDTDQIFPSRFTAVKREGGNYGGFFMHDLRFDERDVIRTDCLINADELAGAQIIVAQANYACGSARMGAIASHVDFGIRAIIAESFGPVFPSVAFKFGLLTVTLGKEQTAHIRNLVVKKLGTDVTIDLVKQEVTAPDGLTFRFEYDDFQKKMFIQSLSELDITRQLQLEIDSFEGAYKKRHPWA